MLVVNSPYSLLNLKKWKAVKEKQQVVLVRDYVFMFWMIVSDLGGR